MNDAPFVPVPLVDLYLEQFPAAAILTYDGGNYISPAQVKMFARCPEQYRQRYVLGRKERPNAAMLWGSADHATIEANMRQKMVSHKDMTVADIKELFAADLDERVARDGGPAEVEWKKGETHTGGDADRAFATVKDNGVALVACYHEQVCPSVYPTAVEEEFVVPGKTLGLPVDLKGRIDLRGLVPDPNGAFKMDGEIDRVERIIDRKTAAQKKKLNANPEWVTAARIYQLGEHVTTGTMHGVDYHLSLKPGDRRKAPAVVAHDPDMLLGPTPPAMVVAQIRRTLVGISFLYATYGPDDPWPGAWAGFASSCDYCGFRPDCPWWVADRWVAA